jgi:hypothetical protein
MSWPLDHSSGRPSLRQPSTMILFSFAASMSVIICSYSFTLIILGNQEVLMARKEPHFRSEKTSLYVGVPCSAAARAVAQLGFFINLVGKFLAGCTLIGAAGFVAVLSEPTSSR